MSPLEAQPATEAAPLTQMQRIPNTFAAPSKTFEDIKRGNRSWWLPLIIMALGGYLLFAAVSQKIGLQTVVDNQVRLDPKSQERMAQSTPEQRATGNKIAVGITEGVFLGGPLIGLLGAAVLSGVIVGAAAA